MHARAEAMPPNETMIPAPAHPKPSNTDWPSSLQSLLTTVVIAVFVISFVVQAFQIPSESMENTLLIGDYLLVDKLCYGGGGGWGRLPPYPKIQHGGLIRFPPPGPPSPPFLKRVGVRSGGHGRLLNR